MGCALHALWSHADLRGSGCVRLGKCVRTGNQCRQAFTLPLQTVQGTPAHSLTAGLSKGSPTRYAVMAKSVRVFTISLTEGCPLLQAGNLERQYSSSSDATAASSDGSNGSGAPAGSRKQRSVDELTEAENWHLQRAYAELARLQHLQVLPQSVSHMPHTNTLINFR